MNSISACFTSAALLVLAGLSVPAGAQRFPGKQIRIVVPVAAGGNLDLVTRTVAQKLTEQMGQQVIVENRPGVSGIVGTEFAAVLNLKLEA